MESRRKRMALRVVGIVAAFAGAYATYLWVTGEAPVIHQDTETAARETDTWKKTIEEKGRDGDWLVVRGYKVSDHLIAGATFTKLTHAVILDRDAGEVIEAIKPKVKTTSLRDFLEKAHRVVLIRPSGSTVEKGRAAVSKARTRLGAPYDFLGVIGIPSEKRFYCSELAVWSWGIKVDRTGPEKVVHPASLLKYGEDLFDSGPRQRK